MASHDEYRGRELIANAIRDAVRSGADTDFTTLGVEDLADFAVHGDWWALEAALEYANDPRWREIYLVALVAAEEVTRERSGVLSAALVSIGLLVHAGSPAAASRPTTVERSMTMSKNETPTPTYDMVIYHANCFDGFTAAWVARTFLADPWADRESQPEFVAATHGDPPPDVTGRCVLIVDFSYPRAVLEEMAAKAELIRVLDHHVTAQKDLEGLPFAHFSMDKSGAGLALEHFGFFPDGEVRWVLYDSLSRCSALVRFVEDRDLWKFEFKETKAVHAAMTACPMTFEAWDGFAEDLASDLEGVVERGEVILAFSSMVGEKIAARAGITTVLGTRCWVVNAPFEFVGEIATALYERTDEHGQHLPVLTWNYDAARSNYSCSLRSRADGVNVAELAMLLGGGGHEHAAGFRSKTLPALGFEACFNT